MIMTEETWVKIAELLEGDKKDVAIGMSMINQFPMTGNRAQVVTLILVYHIKNKDFPSSSEISFVSHCKNWYWFIYNNSSGFVKNNGGVGKDPGVSLKSEHLHGWLGDNTRTEEERKWQTFFNRWRARKVVDKWMNDST
jgi:hypothetical protein